jgi:2-iminoacetate synthase
MDYAAKDTKEVGEALILKEMESIPNEKVRKIVMENLRAIEEENRRDFRF